MTTLVQEHSSDEVRPARRALVVLGMHRSGTSAMTRVLSLLGGTLPQHIVGPREDNPAGFWEPWTIAQLNDEILHALDSEWDDVFASRPRHYLSNFDRFYVGRAVEMLEQEYNGSEVIILKDPRISILTTFWDRALREAGYAAHYVVMVRNPLEVAESLRTRDGFPREKSLLLWSSYMVAMDRDTRDLRRTFVSYDQLIGDWRSVRDRIQEDTGIPFPRDTAAAAIEIDRFLDGRLHHHQLAARDLFSRSDVSDEVKTLYRIFSAACEGADIDCAAVDAVRAELALIESIVGPVVADLSNRARILAKDFSELQQAHSEACEASATLSEQLEAERQLRKAEAETFSQTAAEHERQRADLADRIAAAEAERDRVAAEANELELRAANLSGQIDKTGAESRKLREKYDYEIGQMRLHLEALNQRIADQNAAADEAKRLSVVAHSELRSTQQKLRAAESSMANLKKNAEEAARRLGKAERDLTERYHELADLSRALVAEENRGHRREEQVKWLREVHSMLLSGEKWWFVFMPRVWRNRRKLRRLANAGLFDSEAYLGNYPDVAESGQDPLRHYIVHGMDENRLF